MNKFKFNVLYTILSADHKEIMNIDCIIHLIKKSGVKEIKYTHIGVCLLIIGKIKLLRVCFLLGIMLYFTAGIFSLILSKIDIGLKKKTNFLIIFGI